MNSFVKLAALFFLICMVFFISCKKERSCETCINGNQLPIASAGPDQLIALPTDRISLDGTASKDRGGKISEWLWRKISGPCFYTIKTN